jgi:hypothetical protein
LVEQSTDASKIAGFIMWQESMGLIACGVASSTKQSSISKQMFQTVVNTWRMMFMMTPPA